MRVLLLFVLMTFASSFSVFAQQDAPVVVQPGRPGAPSKTLPSDTRAVPVARSQKDVEFMQGMIMHHAQAVEMVALIESRTETKSIRQLGARIGLAQSDEIGFMTKWLENRGEKTSMEMDDDDMEMDMDMPSHHSHSLMPGMLSAAQMSELRAAKGAEFDRLFLKGMIQHHKGALVMVKDLVNTAGAGQEAMIFTFATDIDAGQRGEIRIMENLLQKLN